MHVRDQGRERRGRRRRRRSCSSTRATTARPDSAGHPGGHARQRLHRRHPGTERDVRVRCAALAGTSGPADAAVRQREPESSARRATSSPSPGAVTRPTSSWPAPTSTRCAEGPGINDNGSGSSALLEVAEQMSKVQDREPGALRLVGRRGGRTGRLDVLRQRPRRQRPGRAGRHRDVPQLRHGRLAELRAVPLRRRRVGLRPGRSRRVGRDRGAVRPLLLRAGHPVRGLAVQRPVRLPGVHHQRHPVGWPVHRRRGHQDRRAAGQVGRHRRRGRTTPATTRPATRSTTSARKALGSTPTPSPTRSTCTRPGGEVLNDREAARARQPVSGPFA